MRVTLGWLKEFVDLDLSVEELADKLDLSGTAVESITHLGARFDKIIVGEVTAVEPHPNADRLSYCEVLLNGERAGIVCGAPNVKVGQKVPVALPGAILPSGLRIKPTSIRGVASEGMICSEIELEVGEDASGIMVLPRDSEIGRPLAQVLGLDDWVLELEITPNRPDCMGVIGIAREIAALLGSPMTVPGITLATIDEDITAKVKIDIGDPDLCPRYTARYVDNVSIGPSPVWMRQRLEAVGIRSINNVVDATNYVLIETGQPLHAFDYKLLRGGRIGVRRAKAGEELETIDHVVRKLTADNLVITDGKQPVALAGVMGGFESEISDGTTAVLIESANFAPTNIRKTSRSLGLISESSLRFEKGVDIGGTLYAADRAAQLIGVAAGGRIWAGAIDNYPNPRPPRVISLRPERVNKVLGTDIPADRTAGILKSLELKVEKTKAALEITVPTFRVDLEREVDLIEEVARLYGLNNIVTSLLPSTDADRGLNPLQSLTGGLRALMAASGLFEVVNYSFIGRSELDRLGLAPDHPWMAAVPITNPLSEDQALMRTSLLPSLLRTVSHNYNRGLKDMAIFEIGNVFSRHDKHAQELLMLGGAITGERQAAAWYGQGGLEADFYDVKGLVELVCDKTSLADFHIRPVEHPVLQPGQAAELVAENAIIGFFGALHPRIQENYDLRQPVYIWQLSVAGILAAARGKRRFAEIPRFPGIVLDLALVVDESVSWEQVRNLALETGAPLLLEVRLFDLYRGPGIAAGKKSLAFSLTYQAHDRTLTDDEVDHIQQRLVKRVGKELGAALRES
ncbi:MAG: phenylalanine--tRNA ligase subunit beta [Actinomycetota bacterium]|nr:phenylalanine--tRNA ligase subunit beta [Actinomycetota bacterium]